MKGYLSENQINYVLFHLELSVDLDQEVINSLVFQKDSVKETAGPSIVFKLDKRALDLSGIHYHEEIPILFPGNPEKKIFEIIGKDVVFHHDLLKSIFYLLSGYQEIHATSLDQLGRFPYEQSIQSKLGIVTKPVVNYYFRFISDGIRAFCATNNFRFSEKVNFKNLALLLSHDIDLVDTYNIYDGLFKIKQAVGLAPTNFSRKKEAKIALKYFSNIVGRKKSNPAWSFPLLIETALKHGLKSTYFFLPKDKLHEDAYYRFDEKRIQQLFKILTENGFEIGLHGTVRSARDQKAMIAAINNLAENSPQEMFGIRQHRLLFDIKKTPLLQEEQGLEYDSTLGFAQHEGFRNSCCLPFRLYDHENDRMMNLWELPLAAMDVTLFHYRRLSFDEARSSLLSMVDEAIKFNGIFTILWHNTFFDEEYFPGVTDFFIGLLGKIAERSPEGLTGHQIVKRVSNAKDGRHLLL